MINILAVIIMIVVFFSAIIVWWFTRDTTIVRIKRGQVMDFSTAMNLAQLPIITFHQGKDKYNFIVDSGSSASHINASVPIHHSPKLGTGTCFGAEGNMQKVNVFNITLYFKEREYKHEFWATDLDEAFNNMKKQFGVTVHGLIGTDFMDKYKYVLDFKEKVLYARK